MVNPETYVGSDAKIYIATNDYSTYSLADFEVVLDKPVVSQELTCQDGDAYTTGALACTGTFTVSEFANTNCGTLLDAVVNKNYVEISGNAGGKSLHFWVKSGMILSFNVTLGDAGTITNGSIDWQAKDPYKISSVSSDAAGSGAYITDWG